MTIPTKVPSFDDAVALVAKLHIPDLDTAEKVVAELFGLSPRDVRLAVVAYWDKTDPFSIVNGKVLVRIGVDGEMLLVGVDGAFTLVEFGTADAGIATLDAPAALLERCSHLQSDTIGRHLEEVRGWLETKDYQVAAS